jgi:hypothetical protein
MITLRRLVASLLLLAIAIDAVPVQAGMLSADVGADRQRIATVLERDDVRAQFAARGIGLGEAQARVAALTDAEAADLAAQIDVLPAGSSVLGVALVVFLVLLLTDILGYTKIFPFTKPARS